MSKKYDQGWQDGIEDVCQALEAEALRQSHFAFAPETPLVDRSRYLYKMLAFREAIKLIKGDS